MSKGKLGAQIGHAVQDIVEQAMKETYCPSSSRGRHRLPFSLETYHAWAKYGSRKIVLKGPQDLLESHLGDRDVVYVRDEGRTEVAPDSLTVVAWFPIRDGKTRFKGYALL